MADRTGIEWTDASWNPIVGCSVVSPGCTNCYAMKMAARLQSIAESERAKNIVGIPHYLGLIAPSKGGPVWTGIVRLARPETLAQPLRWRRPRRIFVNSMGDLFHESVPDEWIDRVFAVMALCPQHTFQVLTKRSARMRAYMDRACGRIADEAIELRRTPPAVARGLGPSAVVPLPHITPGKPWWPLPNVWLGVSTEDQRRADKRVPDLLATPAAIRFVSAEPLLGPLNLRRIRIAPDHHTMLDALDGYAIADSISGSGQERAMLDLVIVGGEGGPNARPMHPDWARSLRDRCAAAGTAFFFKQWGEWAPFPDGAPEADRLPPARREFWNRSEGEISLRIGKRAAGRLLDGVEHNTMPEARHG